MAVDQSEITSMNETQTPSGDSKVFINNNGEFEQCELDKLMEATELSKKVSDVNTSLEKKETILGERVISKETETGWYKVAKFNGVKTWCIGNCNFKIYNSGGSDIFNLKLRCKPSPTLGYNVNEMYLKSLNGAFNNRVGVIVEQTITYLVVKHDLYYNTKITINNIISERQNISFELMTPELYSTDENPTLSLIPTGEISDIKNTLDSLISPTVDVLGSAFTNTSYENMSITNINNYRSIQIILRNSNGMMMATSELNTSVFSAYCTSYQKALSAMVGENIKASAYFVNNTTLQVVCTSGYSGIIYGIK